MSRSVLALLLVVLCIVPPASALAWQRAVPPPAAVAQLQTAVPSGRIVIKFAEQAGVTVTTTGLSSPNTAALERVRALLAALAPGARLERRFSRPAAAIDAERRQAEQRTGRTLPDLNAYGQLIGAAGGDVAALSTIVERLARDPAIEIAFLEPVAVPAALGFDAATGAVPARHPRRDDLAAASLVTPDFIGLQGYLNDPPEGIGALSVAATPGADGATVQVIDVEGAWLWTHEDLPSPFITIGEPIASLSWRNHGTAVLGEIRGEANGFGVRGITPACAVGASSIGDQSTADAISNATAALAPGDIILIELHAPGPNATGVGQFGYVCMEFWQDNFDAMLLAAANGLIVCEAAGNGEQDLDDPVYLGLFDRTVRDSGAILCGASAGADLAPAWFTNYGSRVDLHGWGQTVVTCGYGWLQGEPLPEEEWYTDGFSGTSSASPIVVGAVASLQGMVKNAYGFPLDARLARDILVQTGTPQAGTQQIGPRPSLVDAWALADGGIGRVTGTVTDQASGLEVAGARVVVEETGAFDLTAADGSYQFALLPGDFNLNFSSFFHQGTSEPLTITSGNTTTLDVALVPKPTVELVCRVSDTLNAPLAAVTVTPRGVPIVGGSTGPDGIVRLSDVPLDTDIPLLFHQLPGFGAGAQTARVETGQVPPGGDALLFQTLPDALENFESGGGGFVADNLWTHGTPQAGGPLGGFSGSNCWGVGMTGDYPDDALGHLESPAYDFAGAEVLFLSFHHWRETEPGFDGVNLQVWTGGDWEVRTPLTDYTDITLGGLGFGPGWSGYNGEWEGCLFDLTDLTGPAVRFRLAFGSDSGVNGPGFWIDEIAFETAAAAAVEMAAPSPGATRAALAAFPNPFNPQVTIGWRIASPGRLRLELYDVLGRHRRTLLDERVPTSTGQLRWDGRDGAGAPVASGVYLLELHAPDGSRLTRRVVLTR